MSSATPKMRSTLLSNSRITKARIVRDKTCIANGISANNSPNPHILFDALIGGTLQEDSFVDDRTGYTYNEVTTNYNAGFQGLIMALK